MAALGGEADTGSLLLRQTDRAIRLFHGIAHYIVDRCDTYCIVHDIRTLVAQRLVSIALRYEGVDDYETFRHDPDPAVLSQSLPSKRLGLCAFDRVISVRGIMTLLKSSHIGLNHYLLESFNSLFGQTLSAKQIVRLLGRTSTSAWRLYETFASAKFAKSEFFIGDIEE